MGLRIQDLMFGFRVEGVGFLWFRVSGLGFRVSGLGFRVLDSGSRVSGLSLTIQG